MSIVGAVNFVSSRFGILPLGFEEPLIILAGVHFTYAGMIAPLLVGLTGRRLPLASTRLRSQCVASL